MKYTFKEGDRVCVSLKNLFETEGIGIGDDKIYYTKDSGNRIVRSGEYGKHYYDLMNFKGAILCCDGEEVRVTDISEDGVTFVNTNGEVPHIFCLTHREASYALFSFVDREKLKEYHVTVELHNDEDGFDGCDFDILAESIEEATRLVSKQINELVEVN